MRHRTARNLLPDYTLGLLSQDALRDLESHVSDCRACGQDVDRLTVAVGALAAVLALDPALMHIADPIQDLETDGMARISALVVAALTLEPAAVPPGEATDPGAAAAWGDTGDGEPNAAGVRAFETDGLFEGGPEVTGAETLSNAEASEEALAPAGARFARSWPWGQPPDRPEAPSPLTGGDETDLADIWATLTGDTVDDISPPAGNGTIAGEGRDAAAGEPVSAAPGADHGNGASEAMREAVGSDTADILARLDHVLDLLDSHAPQVEREPGDPQASASPGVRDAPDEAGTERSVPPGLDDGLGDIRADEAASAPQQEPLTAAGHIASDESGEPAGDGERRRGPRWGLRGGRGDAPGAAGSGGSPAPAAAPGPTVAHFEPDLDDIRSGSSVRAREAAGDSSRRVAPERSVVRPQQRTVEIPDDPFGFLSSADTAIPEPEQAERAPRHRPAEGPRWALGFRRQRSLAREPQRPGPAALPEPREADYGDADAWAALAGSVEAPPVEAAAGTAAEPPSLAPEETSTGLVTEEIRAGEVSSPLTAAPPIPAPAAQASASPGPPEAPAPAETTAAAALPGRVSLESLAREDPSVAPPEIGPVEDPARDLDESAALAALDTTTAEAPETPDLDEAPAADATVPTVDLVEEPEASPGAPPPDEAAVPDAEVYVRREGDAVPITSGDGFVFVDPPKAVSSEFATGTETWVPGPDDARVRRGLLGRMRGRRGPEPEPDESGLFDQALETLALQPYRSTVPPPPLEREGVRLRQPDRWGRRPIDRDEDPRAFVSFDEEIRRLARPNAFLPPGGVLPPAYLPGPVEWGLERYDDAYTEEEEDGERAYALASGALVDSSWRFWAILLGVFSAVLFGILVYGYFFVRDLNTETAELANISESSALPIRFSVVTTTENFNTRGEGFYDKQTGRAILSFGGLPPIEREQFYIIWATAGDVTQRVGNASSLGGSSQYVELRNVPEGVTRIFMTVESPVEGQPPAAPAGPVLLEANVQ